MFAVPGWNVSAKIVAQVEQLKPKDPNKLGKKALKRKQKQEEQVNAENLVEHWEKNFGNEVAKALDKTQRDADVAGEKADGSQDKRGKKRKRGRTGGKKDKQDGGDTQLKDSISLTVVKEAEKSKTEEDLLGNPAATTTGESRHEKKKRKKDHEVKSRPDTVNDAIELLPAATVDLLPGPKGLTPLQKSMRNKLASARFRHLNESLYTKPSFDSFSLFKGDPFMFEDYHRGFAQQVEVWPENPVDGYVSSIITRGKLRPKAAWKDKKRKGKDNYTDIEEETDKAPLRGDAKPLPRNFKHHSTIADLGCGTASLSYRLQPHLQSISLTLHSFDLSRPSGPSASLVTVADIAALPLPDNSVDVTIFCLALMGTNWLDFIDEAYRILRWRGELWISEIKSRFGRVEKSKNTPGRPPINSIGSLKKPLGKNVLKGKKKGEKPLDGAEEIDPLDEAELAVIVDGATAHQGTDVSAFVEVLRHRGFVLDALPERPSDAIDLSNKMFVRMQFFKGAHPNRGKNAKEDQRVGAGAKPVGLKMGIKGKKFAAVSGAEEDSGENDARVLKPCLYKIR